MDKKFLFILSVCVFVCLYVRVITYGHINEKGENKHTIWLKLYTLKVYPKLFHFAFGVKRDNFLMGLKIDLKFEILIKEEIFLQIKRKRIFKQKCVQALKTLREWH